VRELQSSGDGSTGVTASIHDVFPVVVLGVVQQGLDSGLCETPCSGVKRLLLAPDDGLRVGVRVQVLLE